MKILLKAAYDGRHYCGWQVQKNGPSIQGEISRAAAEIYGQGVKVTGCSRTDSGVHALCYCFTVEPPLGAPSVPLDRLPVALNVRLNEDITVFSAEERDDDFHARYSVRSKTYEYRIDNGLYRDPFKVGYTWHLKKPLDENVMNAAARSFIGKRDFSAFMASGSDVTDTVREVTYAEVVREGSEIIFRVSADGFLYNMVRIMVGTLTDVSYGKIGHQDIDGIIASRDRKKAGLTAPPDGLYLKSVAY
jgi:tRNA pseudouridine38-40 synthase